MSSHVFTLVAHLVGPLLLKLVGMSDVLNSMAVAVAVAVAVWCASRVRGRSDWSLGTQKRASKSVVFFQKEQAKA